MNAPLAQLRTTLAVLALALAIWLVAMSVLRPISLLLKETRRLATGQRGTVQLGIKRNDEPGQLAHEFERMAAQVDQSHNSLEDQVAART